MRGLLLMLVLLGAGCDRLDGDGVYVPEQCETQVALQLHPQGGEEAAWTGAIVWADLACADPTAVLSLTRGGGPIEGAVETLYGGRQVRFVPDEPLRPEAGYTARLDTPSGFVEWDFFTSALGEPVGSELAERALALFPAQAGVLEPAGFHDELRRLLRASVHPVVQFQGEPSGGGVAMRWGGRASDDVGSGQDPAVAAVDLIASWQEPVWSGGEADLVFPGDGYALRLEDTRLSGAVAPGVAWGGGGGLVARWDLREADGGLGPDFASPCVVNLDAGGEGCVPCRDGARACLPVDLRDIPALAWGGLLQAR